MSGNKRYAQWVKDSTIKSGSSNSCNAGKYFDSASKSGTNQKYKYRLIYYEYVKFLNEAVKSVMKIEPNFDKGFERLNFIEKIYQKIRKRTYLLNLNN